MSNNGTQEIEAYRDWHLYWGGAWEKEDSEIPLFPSYYSYLLKLAPGVGLVDIYPWLAELMFFSVAVDGDSAKKQNEIFAPINVISIFVDDNSDNVAISRLNSERRKNEYPINELIASENSSYNFFTTKPKLFMVDTFGQFKNARTNSSVLAQTDGHHYTTSQLVGAGNPMQMMRRFTEIGKLPLNSDGERGVFPGEELGKLNCFVINSISNLYRSMGVRDAMLLVRAMMEQGVWKSGGESADESKEKLIDNKGMLFAVLHDQVFPQADTMYIETFFDGVITFKKEEKSALRKTTFYFERFPPSVPDWRSTSYGNLFQPDFSASWTYTVEIDGRLTVKKVPIQKNRSLNPLKWRV